MNILAIDPGVVNAGVAVFRDGALVWYRYLSLYQENSKPIDENPLLRWAKRFLSLIDQWGITQVLCEDFIYQGGARAASQGYRTKEGPQSDSVMSLLSPGLIAERQGQGILQLIGAIQMFPLLPPYPHVLLLHPGRWRKQLTGDYMANDELVNWVLEKRLGKDILSQGKKQELNHCCDAIGLGLAWLDTAQLARAAQGVHGPCRSVGPKKA